jgi:plastocyanin
MTHNLPWRFLRSNRLTFAIVLALAIAGSNGVPAATAQGTRNVTVLVGAGQDTLQALAFFPQALRIHQGDTVTWKRNGDELHTVSFTRGVDPGPTGVPAPSDPSGARIPAFGVPAPGGGQQLNPQIAWPTRARGSAVERYTGTGFISSGLLVDEPLAENTGVNEVFPVAFPNAGLFSYICLIHPEVMRGTVEVVPTATTTPDQAAIDAQANAEVAAMMRLLQAAKTQGEMPPRRDPAPNGSTTWYARAGGHDFVSGDTRAQVLDFQPKNLVIAAGDTVVWTARYFHTVSFVPSPEPPELFDEAVPGPTGAPIIPLDPMTVNPARPAPTYDPTQYYNSGLLGQFTTLGDAWSLTFTQPGTFEVLCLIHDEQGMKGTITVQPPGAAPVPPPAPAVAPAAPAE